MSEDSMDEIEMQQESLAGQEVVLTYAGEEPVPVVLTYEAELPEAMRPPQPPRRRRRSRRGLMIFMICIALLLLVSSVLLIYSALSSRTSIARPGGGTDNIWADDSAGETTIETYPTGGDFRIDLSEVRLKSLTAQKVYAHVNPSVVSVVADLGDSVSVGTGVIASSDGYIITNYHVIEGGHSCLVILSTGYRLDAKLVGYDADNDLAVLKVEGEDLPAAEFGSSDLLSVGDKVYAIGNPLGLELRGTLTDGIISAINRDVDVDGVTMTLIQTNAALNSGNSGGPLINEFGQVIGINTIKMVSEYDDDSVEGLGFAIPSATVAHIANCIIATGEVTPEPVLGITVMGTAILPDGSEGVLVVEVSQGGAAAGVQPGDIIVEADGERVTTNTDILRIRRRFEAGESVPMTIYRDGEYIDVQVELTPGAAA